VYGRICAERALAYIKDQPPPAPHPAHTEQIEAERQRVLAPLSRPHGIPHHQYEYKVRRLVNDYLQPPKSGHRLELGLRYLERAEQELAEVGAENPHDLMRVMECHFIRDCAEMAARASLYRTESRWGLYHYRQDYPELNDERWRVHVNLKKSTEGAMEMLERPVAPYVVPLGADELRSYHRLRISPEARPAAAVGAQA
jgi:succinate dehydrogenase/fumarate reductase flavoprotein subunit